MSDDKNISVAVQALWPGGIAALMQLAMTYAMSLKLRPAQLAGAILVSTLTAACVSILLSTVMHVPATAAAAIGAMTGALPAVIMPVFVLRVAAQKLGVDVDDFGSVLNALRNQAEGGAVEPMPAAPIDPNATSITPPAQVAKPVPVDPAETPTEEVK